MVRTTVRTKLSSRLSGFGCQNFLSRFSDGRGQVSQTRPDFPPRLINFWSYSFVGIIYLLQNQEPLEPSGDQSVEELPGKCFPRWLKFLVSPNSIQDTSSSSPSSYLHVLHCEVRGGGGCYNNQTGFRLLVPVTKTSANFKLTGRRERERERQRERERE